MRSLLLLFATIAAVILPMAAGRAASNATPDFCDEAADNVVVYVDRTTPYDEADKTALIDGVSRLFESLEGGERFAIRTVAENFAASASLLDACVPFCPSKGFLDDLFSTVPKAS
jgi:hypothetical protein